MRLHASPCGCTADAIVAIWLFVGVGVVLAVVALPFIVIGAVAQGRRWARPRALTRSTPQFPA